MTAQPCRHRRGPARESARPRLARLTRAQLMDRCAWLEARQTLLVRAAVEATLQLRKRP